MFRKLFVLMISILSFMAWIAWQMTGMSQMIDAMHFDQNVQNSETISKQTTKASSLPSISVQNIEIPNSKHLRASSTRQVAEKSIHYLEKYNPDIARPQQSRNHAVLNAIMKENIRKKIGSGFPPLRIREKMKPMPSLNHDALRAVIKANTFKPSVIEVYEFETRMINTYKSVNHMNHIHFAQLLNKNGAQRVIAKVVCKSTCRTLNGEGTAMRKFFVYVENTQKIFESSFWILINESDLIRFFRELGYMQTGNQVPDANTLSFRRFDLATKGRGLSKLLYS